MKDDEEQENRALLITLGVFFALFIIAVMLPSYAAFGEGNARALSFWWIAGEFLLALCVGLTPRDTPVSKGVGRGGLISAGLLFLVGFCTCVSVYN